MTREELINSKEYKVVNAAFDWIEEHKDADLLDAFEAGAEWADKTMLDRVCQWLTKNTDNYMEYEGFDHNGYASYGIDVKNLTNNLRKAMEQ